jgi:hypothetical protein
MWTLVLYISLVHAGCWNVITNSRCDNENVFRTIGYTCNERCVLQGYWYGVCRYETDTCLGNQFTTRICTCY